MKPTLHSLHSIIVLVVMILASLAGAAQPAAAQTGSGDAPPFEVVPCPLGFPVRYEVTCGYVTVPEQHANPGGPAIRVMIAVFSATNSPKQADPVLMLSGGPGTNTLESYAGGLGRPLDLLLAERDVILLDQRGMGYSEPNLGCPEVDAARQTNVAGNGPSADELAALWACRDRLAAEGVNLAAFNTVESAGDVDAVRRALGLESLNIVTGSYGSTLTLTAMRHYPAGIRSAVIAAPAPPEIDLIGGFAPNFYRALEDYFARCADDPNCGGRFPGVRDQFYALADQFATEPVELELPVPGLAGPVDLTIDARLLYSGIQMGLYAGYDRQIAGLIAAVYAQQYDVIAPLVAASLSQSPVTGAFYSFRCADDVYTTSPEEVAALAEPLPGALRDAAVANASSYFDICAEWPAAHLDPAESQPVTGGVPALFLQGDLDPVSSPEWTIAAAAALEHGRVVRFPDSGHYILGSAPCSDALIAAFIEDPFAEFATSCQGWY